MKKGIVALLMIAAMAISLSACASTETSNESIIEEEQEEIVEEEPEQGELEEEEPKEEPEEDKPLDIEANVKLKSMMEVLAAIEDGGFKQGFDYNLTFINDLYALEEYAITALMYDVSIEYGLPEGGHTEADAALFSVKQVENIIGSLVGHEVDLSLLANEDGWIETDLRTDVFYTDCKNWNTEYIGNNAWKVYVDVYSISLDGDGSYKKAEMIYTVIENPDSILDGYSIIEVEATQLKMSEWAKAYYDYLLENIGDFGYGNDCKCYLIYLDNNDIPELYVDPGLDDKYLLCYSDGQIKETYVSMYSSIQYISQSGLYMEKWDALSYPSALGTAVYQLINGEYVEIVHAVAVMKDEYADEYEGESWMYDYTVNGELVSEEEYNRRLDEAFDTSRAIELRYDEDNALDFYSLLTYLTSLEDTE